MSKFGEREAKYWDFVVENYPNYQSSEDIAYNEDLFKLVDGQISGDAEELLENEYGGNTKNEQIEIDYNASTVEILEDAILGYIEKQK